MQLESDIGNHIIMYNIRKTDYIKELRSQFIGDCFYVLFIFIFSTRIHHDE